MTRTAWLRLEVTTILLIFLVASPLLPSLVLWLSGGFALGWWLGIYVGRQLEAGR